MTRGRRGRGQQQSIKGFRPGREPAQLRRQRAQAHLGPDANWAQKRLVDALADRSPEEARGMLRRWRLGLMAGVIVLAAAGTLLYRWSVVGGILVHVVAAGLLALWFQLRRKQSDFETLADLVSGRRRR
jgi:Flp pilus assembly protein TadB